MANKFVRNIDGIKDINKQGFNTNNQNDLLSDKKDVYVRRDYTKDSGEFKQEYYKLTDAVKSVNNVTADENGNVQLENVQIEVDNNFFYYDEKGVLKLKYTNMFRSVNNNLIMPLSNIQPTVQNIPFNDFVFKYWYDTSTKALQFSVNVLEGSTVSYHCSSKNNGEETQQDYNYSSSIENNVFPKTDKSIIADETLEKGIMNISLTIFNNNTGIKNYLFDVSSLAISIAPNVKTLVTQVLITDVSKTIFPYIPEDQQ